MLSNNQCFLNKWELINTALWGKSKHRMNQKNQNTEWMEACKEVPLLFRVGKDFFQGIQKTQEKTLINLTSLKFKISLYFLLKTEDI